jgi:hypothetical protein
MTCQFPETLRALKQASDEAKETYYAHKRSAGLSVDQAIAFDLTERRLMRAHQAAEAAYKAEMDNWLVGAGGIR